MAHTPVCLGALGSLVAILAVATNADPDQLVGRGCGEPCQLAAARVQQLVIGVGVCVGHRLQRLHLRRRRAASNLLQRRQLRVV